MKVTSSEATVSEARGSGLTTAKGDSSKSVKVAGWSRSISIGGSNLPCVTTKDLCSQSGSPRYGT